jgi:hypothetical protein
LNAKILGYSILALTFMLCGCPGKVNPGDPQGSGLGKVSSIWGMPMIRTVTGGFNGVPSESNDAGPANTKKASP